MRRNQLDFPYSDLFYQFLVENGYKASMAKNYVSAVRSINSLLWAWQHLFKKESMARILSQIRSNQWTWDETTAVWESAIDNYWVFLVVTDRVFKPKSKKPEKTVVSKESLP